VADESFAALTVAAETSASGAEWHVIRAGKELGPLSLAELVKRAGAKEIGDDDLVKQTGSLWTEARNFGFLRQQFLLNDSVDEASQGTPAQPNHETKGTVSTGACAIFVIGAVLFLLGHGGDFVAWPLVFLITCCIWGAVFGTPAYVCFRDNRRTGVTTVGILFLIAAGLDVGVGEYNNDNAVQSRQIERLPARHVSIDQKLKEESPKLAELFRLTKQTIADQGRGVPPQYESNMMNARNQVRNMDETVRGRVIGDIPFFGACLAIGHNLQLGQAKRRIAAGNPEPNDFFLIAQHERLAQIQR